MPRDHREQSHGCFIVVMSLICLAGCARDCPIDPTDGPPIPCVRMGVERYYGDCPLDVAFCVNPDCSHDDCTPQKDLQIRWDFGADGTWDTGFGPLEIRWDAGPQSVSATVWRLRYELMDLAGHTGERVDTLDLRPLLPRPPDIIAGRVMVTLARPDGMPESPWREVDTLSVGQRFCVWISLTCWMDPTEDVFLIETRLDGQVLDSAWAHTTPPLHACHAYGKCGLTTAQAGTHDIQVILDADNTIPETNEMNNIATKSVIVVDAPPNK